jgi:DegV family protein with EDD domain
MRLDGDLKTDEIFEFVQKTKVLPKTSAINEFQYTEHFEKLLADHDAVVHISLSSEISSACSNAKAAASKMQNIYIVDSRTLSTGIALLAIYASKLASNGNISAAEIAKLVADRTQDVQASFIVERLDYLHKGGRCSSIALLGANLLKIRPQIVVKDGKMQSAKKYRGNIDKVIEDYCKDVVEQYNTPDLSVGFITYTTATEGMVSAARKALEEKGFKEIYETRAGATIASHCGEHTLGILYINDNK